MVRVKTTVIRNDCVPIVVHMQIYGRIVEKFIKCGPGGCAILTLCKEKTD